ncbi:MAG: GerMN domain-containing protein [Spirochaetaceae bacterium]|nr:GerMN domain-containing protein [Spirochaetaceae bacterium]
MVYLVILACFALVDFIQIGLVRRTLMFYAIEKGNAVVEERFFPRSGSRELDIRRYIEDVLLGPATPDSAPLFPRETKLETLLYRKDTLYVGLSEAAALPPLEGGNVFTNLYTLYSEIQQNFRYIKDVKFFIKGNEVFYGDF